MKILFLSFFLGSFVFEASYAHDLSLSYDKSVTTASKKILESSMEEVSALLPLSFKKRLPNNIVIKVLKLTDHIEIPDEACEVIKEDSTNQQKKKPFVYGSYNKLGNTLIINEAVVRELGLGKAKSKRISCQHKSLYNQSIATIIHELTHAFDLNGDRISNTIEFINKAGYKKGVFKTKSKNVDSMRSTDVYELENIVESFAVNMEYFLMDSEFMCRKPSLFDFYKRLLGVDPYPERNCILNSTVMVSSQLGYIQAPLLSNRVYRIDYLLAAPGKGISSGFGHSMFRIVTCAPERFDPISNRIIPETEFGEKCLNDKLYHLVVSYRANMDDGKLNYLKGLTGGYPSMLFILSFNDVLNEYNRDELRDIVSYPLKLSKIEREEFVLRVREEHWNYRGSYKFITNNCAVESYDLLKGALNVKDLESKSSITPNGVLKDLNDLKYLSVKDSSIENYDASTDQIILAYNKAYGYNLKTKDKANKTAVLKFIDSSTPAQRMDYFNQFSKTKIPTSDMNAELTYLKERLVIASSFSVLEQQINRSLSLKFRKKAADLVTNSKDEKILALGNEVREALTINFNDFSNAGYGIPLMEEMASSEDINEKAAMSNEAMEKTEKFLKELMPVEFAILESISKNTQIYNKYSLSLRKDFRSKLETYIKQVLKNLTREDFTKDILIKAANGDVTSINKVRELIGKELVTDKEILDSKLVKLIQELI